MTPYYQDSSVTIYHGDCRELLSEIEKGDLVISDPPYGIAFRSNHRTIKHDSITGDVSLSQHSIRLAISMATRAAYIFCRWDQLWQLPVPTSLVVWIKNNWSMGDLKHEHGRQWEACAFYPKPAHQFIKRIPDVIYSDRTGNNLHPTQKPVSLIATLISANEGNVVLDPFMGSGTTLRAAKDLNRKAIGIEIEERYCEIAAKRMAQEVLALAV